LFYLNVCVNKVSLKYLLETTSKQRSSYQRDLKGRKQNLKPVGDQRLEFKDKNTIITVNNLKHVKNA
jgi:hypothetical protein